MSRRLPRDPQGRHIRLYATMLDSVAYRTLGWPSRSLLIDLRATVTATNNGAVGAPLKTMKHRGWTSPSTLASALYELRALGFLAVTREGGLRQGTRVTTLYRFTDLDVYEQPKYGIPACKPTHDYLRFETLAAAEAALRDGVGRLRENGRAKQAAAKSPVRETYRSGTGNVPEARSIGTGNVQGERPSVRKTYRVKTRAIASEAA